MFYKLSISNIKKSFRDYAIYFATLTFGVCIFYIFNSIDSQTAMIRIKESTSEKIEMLIEVLSYVSVFISIILGLLIIYASRFLIKKRTKEFAIYMLLGVPKRKILILLLLETVIVGVISLIVGLGLGVALSQVTSIFVVNMFEVNMNKFVFNFSTSATLKTIVHFEIIYAIVMLVNVIVINRSKLINLLQASKKQEQIKIKNPIVCVVLFIIAVMMLSRAYYIITTGANSLIVEALNHEKVLLKPIGLGVVGTVLLFYSVTGMFLVLVSKWHNKYYKNLNTFVFKQISSKVNTMVISISVICIMIFTTLCMLSSSCAMKEGIEYRFNKYMPVDLELTVWQSDIDLNNIMEDDIIKKNTKDMIMVDVYRADDKKAVYWFINDKKNIISYSDYNKLAKVFNFDTITLKKDEYAVVATTDFKYWQEKIDAGATMDILGRNLRPYKNIVEGFLEMDTMIVDNKGIIVVSDDIAKSCNKIGSVLALNYNTYKKGSESEVREIVDQRIFEVGVWNHFINKNYKKDIYSSLPPVAVMVLMYVGSIFLIASLAILSLNQLSSCIDDKNQYRILRQIGVSEKEINKALYKQTFVIFVLPLFVAAIHTYFGLQFCRALIYIHRMKYILGTVLVVIAIYIMYFVVTCIYSRNIIND